MAGQGCAPAPVLYTNRIHRDDCVGFLAHLVQRQERSESVEPCYLAVDNEPVPMWDVKQWLAVQLGVDPQQLSDGERNRRNSKRCSNKRMLATGYQLQYPNYQSGYSEVVQQFLDKHSSQ